jgi:hypothetical protein
MPDEFSPPPEVLAFLVRTLPPRELWSWLGEDDQISLRHKVARGFRATSEVLRQPAARSRLASHLQNAPGDVLALLNIWEATAPRVLEEVRALDDETLIAQLSALQEKHGIESLLLTLLREEKDEAIEAWTSAAESEPSTLAVAPTSSAETDDASPSESALEAMEKLKRQFAREEKKADHWREKYKELQTRAAQSEKTSRDKIVESEKLAREASRNSKAESHRAGILEAKLEDSEKARERAERRARSTQAENEAATAELKTIKRQLHRLQQINEELRGQLAASLRREEAAKLSAAEAGREASTLAASGADSPENSGAVASRRDVENSTEKIKAAIDRNDEPFVATLREQISALRARDGAACKNLLKRVRALGKFYERVLTGSSARVLVDASNVARHDAAKKGRLAYLLAMRDELRRHSFFPIIFVADASLPHFIDEPKTLRAMVARCEVEMTASGQQADEVLARQARQTGAYVVTNDRNFHFAFAPDFTPSRIGFRIEDGVVLLDEF